MMEEASVQARTSEIIAASAGLQRMVLDLWQHIRIDWSYASDQLSKKFRAEKQLTGERRRAVAETLYAMIRNLRRVDYAIARGGRASNRDRDALRLWATLVLEFALPPETARGQFPSFDWIAIASSDVAIAKERDATARLGIGASLPDWLAAEFADQHGKDAAELAVALSKRAPMTVRVNTLKTTREALRSELSKAGFETTPGVHSETALHFETRTNIFGLLEFKSGLFEAQDEGSQLIAELVAPPPKAKVVDYCAGAGGKALALAALMNNRGRIACADVAHRKLTELRRRAKRAGVGNIAVAPLSDDPLAALPKALDAWTERADRVLVDAPCTGVGALRRNPEIRWRLCEADLARLPLVQGEILERASTLVAAGGRLIYATCSVLEQENQAVVERFLSSHSEYSLMAPKEIWGRARADALTDPSDGFMELTPQRHGSDGFFAAVLRRKPR